MHFHKRNSYHRIFIFLTAVLLLITGRAAELSIFVSPNGDDGRTGQGMTTAVGSTDGPVKTVAQAQQLARAQLLKMRAGTLARQAIRIEMAPGEYQLQNTLVFGAGDSGFAGAPVTYEAERPGTVLLTGGVQLAPKQGNDGIARFEAPQGQVRAIFGGSQLFVQGQRAVLARMPDSGKYWFVEKPIALAGEKGEPGRDAFKPEPRALEALASIPANERGRALVNVMSSWSAGRHRLSEGAPAGSVRLKPTSLWPYLKFGPNQRLFVENVSTAFDKAGEWIWTADEVRYLPRAGEDANAVHAVLPMLEKLVEIKGQAGQGAWVENLRFKGIAFAHTRSLVSGDGYFDMQAAVGIGAAIEVEGARNVQFEGCEISHTGGYGIWFKKGVRDSAIVGTVFTDLGAGAIKIGLADQQPGDANATGNNTVLANTITEDGKVYPGAVGVWVGQSFDNEIAYNTIANTTYSAISAGWKWGYSEARSGRNKIVGNLLYNIGQGTLDDMGAIYHLGVAPGTVIADNLIREVRAYRGYGPGGWGIYLDEGSSNMVVEHNVVVGTDSGGLHLHYGRSDTVANNLFAGGGVNELLVTRSDPLLTRLDFRNNLLMPAAERVFGAFAAAPDVQFSGNQVAGSMLDKAPDMAVCGKECAASSAKLTLGPQPRAVQLSGASASTSQMVNKVVAQAGKLPANRMNAEGMPWLIASGPALPEVAVQRPVVMYAPPKDFEVAFGMVSGDMRPLELDYQPKDDKRAIRVTRAADVPGGACLLMDDGPQFAVRYEPYMSARVNFETGEVLGKFSVRFDPAAELVYEWRDAGKPYKTGPTIRFSARGLETQGRLLAKLMPGQWFDIEVAAQLGDNAGTWCLSVSDGKGKPQVFDKLPNQSKDWKQLKWLGFISDAAVKSESCIGQISVVRKKQD